MLFGIALLASIVVVSGTALGAALNVDGDASPINAAPGNSNNAGLLISVIDPSGAAVRGLRAANFEVDATIVAPGGALVDIKRVAEASRAPGFYIVEIAPTTYKGTQYTWKTGIYLFAVTVQRGGDRGQTGVEMDLCSPCTWATTTPSLETPGTVTPTVRLPDLRVTRITAGTPTFEENGREANVPLMVTIKNFGGDTTNRFKISTDVIVGDGGRFVKPFTVSEDIWYPWQNGLGAGEEATFSGNLYIGHPSGPSLYGQSAIIIAMVDSCSGDEFMPDYCRVQESDETNNEKEITIELRQAIMKTLPLTHLKAMPMVIS